MPTPVKSKAVVFSERLYERLLVAYPQSHREEYGPSMAQLFRDQCRDAWDEARGWALLKLWLRVLPDLMVTSLLEHLTALNERKSMFNRTLFGRFTTPLHTFFTVFTLVFMLVFGASVLITFILPESFLGKARIKVERDVAAAQPRADSQQSQSSPEPYSSGYDPYFIQTEFEVMQSEIVLSRVVESLNLNVEWGKKYAGNTLKTSESVELLRKRIDLRPVRSTTLIEIRAFSDQPEEAANIANAIAEAYRVYRLERNREWTLSNIQALEDRWNEQSARFHAAQEKVAKLRVELKVPVPEPAEGELLANYQSYAEAKQRLEELRKFVNALGIQIAQQQTDLSLPKIVPAQIIDHAIANHRPIRPNKPLNIAVGALLGILLGSMAGAGIAGISFWAGRNSQTKQANQTSTKLSA